MRLINADFAINILNESIAINRTDVAMGLRLAMYEIDMLPTIDAVPVKHGEWIEDDDAIITGTCSVCGWNAIFAETDVTGMPYCPNCGARMDGERKDKT